ncbi:MAG: FecR family protein [Mangrovibacterium sp.]
MEPGDQVHDDKIQEFLTDHSEELNLLSRNDAEGAWAKLKFEMYRSRYRVWSKVLQYAAIVVVAFILGVVATNYAGKDLSPVQFATISVPDGQMGNVVLPDGTEVFLNSGSVLRYPDRFDGARRDVYFSGEAYFQVKSDKTHPFFVHLDDYTVKVTGTSFNICSYAGSPVETALIEGNVSILDNQEKKLADLEPDQLFRYDPVKREMKIDPVNTEVYTMWRAGKLFFDNETLGHIAEKLERWYHVKIEFTDNAIREKRLTGTVLKDKPLDQILKILTLKESLNYHMQLNPDERDLVTFSLKK